MVLWWMYLLCEWQADCPLGTSWQESSSEDKRRRSIMVADCVSANYGWLASVDGSKSTWILFKAGKNQEGYFKTKDILNHANSAMDIFDTDYLDEDHVLVFNNTTTHFTWEEDALSASKMVKWTLAKGKNWGVMVPELDENCDPVYDLKGNPLKMQVWMESAKFADGTSQDLYWPEGHPHAGVFKGMAAILGEWGFEGMLSKRGKCSKLKCKPDVMDCCCYQILYFQPDFINIPSKLEKLCKRRRYRVIFLPKFHCELNFIEQCWGFSKHLYWQYPASSKEADLEHNVVTALDSVPLDTMQQYIWSHFGWCHI